MFINSCFVWASVYSEYLEKSESRKKHCTDLFRQTFYSKTYLHTTFLDYLFEELIVILSLRVISSCSHKSFLLLPFVILSDIGYYNLSSNLGITENHEARGIIRERCCIFNGPSEIIDHDERISL